MLPISASRHSAGSDGAAGDGVPPGGALEEGGAFGEVDVLEVSGDFVDLRFTATRPVGFAVACPDALPGTRL